MNLSEINLNDINLQEAGDWPLAGKLVLAVMVIVVVLGAGYYFFTSDQLVQLETVTNEEQKLREEFVQKQRVAANLEAFRAQLAQMEADLDAMLRQLPTGTEMPDLLDDVSNTGKKNGLDFELFKPEAEQPRDFYAAKPITIKAKATYHQFSSFVSGVAALPRIVTLENVTLAAVGAAASKSGKPAAGVKNETVDIQATLQTYRYMDEGSAPARATPRKGAGAAKK